MHHAKMHIEIFKCVCNYLGGQFKINVLQQDIKILYDTTWLLTILTDLMQDSLYIVPEHTMVKVL